MYTKILTLAVCLLVLLDDSSFVLSEPSWTTLRVTWSLNLLSSRAFAYIPRKESEAKSYGYTKLSGECSDGKFLGIRYIKETDPAVIVLYDSNGYIAGIQNGIPKSEVERVHPSYPYAHSTAYQVDRINNQDIYFLTAYFVDPSIICTGGRSDKNFEEQGTGTGLYFQNGSNPITDTIQVPLYEKNTNGSHWVKGGCFRTMGTHYWYEFAHDMSCDKVFPATAIYNRGKITDFAFVNFGYYNFSTRLEHPPKSSLSYFLPEPIPKCINDEYEISGGFTSLHVYFSVRPWNIFC